MRFQVFIDPAGWHDAGSQCWRSVNSDEMKVQVSRPAAPIPDMNDLDAVREYFRLIGVDRNSGIISCDLAGKADPQLVRTVFKSRRGLAMTFQGSLAALAGNFLFELLITATEDGTTGVREAEVMGPIMNQAGPEALAQLARHQFPREWKFERYKPDSTPGCWPYVLSDDERYDDAYPDHPLTRVRRWLRRMEKNYRLIAIPDEGDQPPAPAKPSSAPGLLAKARELLRRKEPIGLGIAVPPQAPVICGVEINYIQGKPMGLEELLSELGAGVAHDLLYLAAVTQGSLPVASLEQRQKLNRDQREADLRQRLERAQRLSKVTAATAKLRAELKPHSTIFFLPRVCASGRWLVQPEGDNLALAVFTGMPAFDDYTTCRNLPSEPIAMTVPELLELFPDLRSVGIDSIAINRCPRCEGERIRLPFGDLNESKLLAYYASSVATRGVFAAEQREKALKESDPAKRLALLVFTLEHLDAGDTETHLEIAKIAVETKDAALFERCSDHISRYAPERLGSLPEGPDPSGDAAEGGGQPSPPPSLLPPEE